MGSDCGGLTFVTLPVQQPRGAVKDPAKRFLTTENTKSTEEPDKILDNELIKKCFSLCITNL